MSNRDKAICLRKTDYSETSQVLHMLTRCSGVVHLMAKGSKRPKSKAGGAIDVLSEGDLVFIPGRNEGLGTLAEFSETSARPGIRRESTKLYTALYMVEMVSRMLAEGDPYPQVFDLLHNSLSRLDEADSPAAALLAFFQWRVLRHVGLLGQLTECISCGQKIIPSHASASREVYFSSGTGGLLCANCEVGIGEKLRLDSQTLAGLATLQSVKEGRPSGRRATMPDAQGYAVNRMLAYHVAQLLHRPLRLAGYVFDNQKKSR